MGDFVRFAAILKQIPIWIFHGDKDKLVSYESSLKLKKYLKDTDTLIRLRGLGHNRITFDEQYTSALQEILSKDPALVTQ